MIDAAIVGLGRWGRTLVDSLGEGSDAIRFTRAVTRTPSRVEDYAAAKGMELGADYRAALADPDVDAVVLATPHSLHRAQIVAAAAAGKHVFCEKPLTLNATDAAAAIEAAEASGVTLAVGHNRRFAPNFRALRSILEEERLGDVLHLEGNFSADLRRAAETWRADASESPAGGMTSLGIHVIDAFIALAGPMISVRANSKRIALPFGVDDATSVLIDFECGCTGYLGTVAATAHLYQLRVIGTGGWARSTPSTDSKPSLSTARARTAAGTATTIPATRRCGTAWRRSPPPPGAGRRFRSRPARSDMRSACWRRSSGRPGRARRGRSERVRRASGAAVEMTGRGRHGRVARLCSRNCEGALPCRRRRPPKVKANDSLRRI